MSSFWKRAILIVLLSLAIYAAFVGVEGYKVWYKENYVEITPGELVTESTYLADKGNFSFEGYGYLNYVCNVIDNGQACVVLNTEKEAKDIVDSITINLLDEDKELLASTELKASKLHTIRGVTSRDIFKAAYVVIAHEDIAVTCDARGPILMGL